MGTSDRAGERREWRIAHVTHESPEAQKAEAIRFWQGDFLWASRSRLEAPWGGETYGLAVAFSGDRCVGTTSYTVSARGQGVLSQVFTDPEWRGLGIATATVREAVEAFRARGGRAMYLAAWKDWVRAIYMKAGFARVGTMGERHAFKLTLDPSGADERLFRPDQRTRIRAMGADDQGDLSSLFNARHPCVVKHYHLGCYLGSHFEPEFYTLRRGAEREGFRALALDGEETVVGFGTVMLSERRHEGHIGILDLLLHENYGRHAPDMVEALEEGCPLERLLAFAEEHEQGRRRLLERMGYRAVGRLEGHLRIDEGRYSLVIYEKAIAGGGPDPGAVGRPGA
jgi:GNAT superfamily N-acetyltransferase